MWIATELKAKTILRIRLSYEKSICYCRAFYIRSLAVGKYGKYPISTTDGGTYLYPQACKFLKQKKQHHIIHLPYEKSIL